MLITCLSELRGIVESLGGIVESTFHYVSEAVTHSEIIVPLAWKNYCSNRKTRGTNLFFPIIGKAGVSCFIQAQRGQNSPLTKEVVKYSTKVFSFEAMIFSS